MCTLLVPSCKKKEIITKEWQICKYPTLIFQSSFAKSDARLWVYEKGKQSSATLIALQLRWTKLNHYNFGGFHLYFFLAFYTSSFTFQYLVHIKRLFFFANGPVFKLNEIIIWATVLLYLKREIIWKQTGLVILE